MIRVTFENIVADGRGRVGFTSERVSFTVEGHAGMGVKGDDIYCAGVSAVVQSCLVALVRIAGIGQEIEQRDGYLRSEMTISPNQEGFREAKAILGVMITGLGEIKQFPGSSIDILWKEV